MEEVTYEDNTFECANCNNSIDEGGETIISERSYCSDCAYTCEDCSTSKLLDDGYALVGDYYYCYDCARTCDRCEDWVRTDDTHTVDEHELWCEYCYENYSSYCENCCNTFSGDVSYVNDTPYCATCYEDNCYWCDDCEESYSNDYPCDCNNRIEGKCCRGYRSSGTIHDYSCKPSPNFKGTSKHGMYLGFELETELRDVEGGARFASNSLQGLAYLKHDGSISNGFEIVTHPHTHTEYRENSRLLWDTIETLRTQYEARSWDTDTCGLHIHLSRNGFKSGAHLHRFIAFVYHNAPHMMKFAGRKTRFARFNDVYTFDEYDRPVFSIKHKTGNPAWQQTERYSAVNTQNSNTIELRFFRGTMNTSGVLSALDLAQAMVEYTRDLSLHDVKLGALQWDWFADYVVSNNGLYPDLYSRLDKIQATDISNKIVANA